MFSWMPFRLNISLSLSKYLCLSVPAPVVSCDWMCDGQRLVTASWDHTTRLWDVEKATVIHTLAGKYDECCVKRCILIFFGI